MSRAAVAAKTKDAAAVRTERAHRSAFLGQLRDATIVRCEGCGMHCLSTEPACPACGCMIAEWAAPASLQWPQCGPEGGRGVLISHDEPRAPARRPERPKQKARRRRRRR